MLDLNFVRENLPFVEEKLRQRGMDPAAVLKDFRDQFLTQVNTVPKDIEGTDQAKRDEHN